MTLPDALLIIGQTYYCSNWLQMYLYRSYALPREREIVHVPNFWTQNAGSVSKFSADSKFKYISKLRNLLYRLLKSANLRYFSSRPNLWTGKLVHPFLIFCFLHSRITWIYQVSKSKRRREREELRCVWDFSVSESHTCLFNLLSRLFSGMLHKAPSKSSLEGSIAWHPKESLGCFELLIRSQEPLK